MPDDDGALQHADGDGLGLPDTASSGPVFLHVLDAEFGLIAVWGEHLAGRMPEAGGIPVAFRPGSVVAGYLDIAFPDLSGLTTDLEGRVFKLDDESMRQLASGKVFKRGDAGHFPQIHTPGEQDARFVQLEEVDLSFLDAAIDSAMIDMEHAKAEVEAGVAVLVDQFNGELERAYDEVARLHDELDGLVRHQLVGEWASLEVDLIELIDMVAAVVTGEALSGPDFAALREAARHAQQSVLRARGELEGLFALAERGEVDGRQLRALGDSLADPMLSYWLQSYARGQVQLMLARSLQLYGQDDLSAAREGQLRQRILDQSRSWSADAELLQEYAQSRVDLEGLGPIRRRKPKQINEVLRRLEVEVEVIAAPLETTWAALPASVGLTLPADNS